MDEKPHEPKPKPAMPPPRKPPGRGAVAGVGGGDDRPKKHETVRIALPPKSTATPTIAPSISRQSEREFRLLGWAVRAYVIVAFLTIEFLRTSAFRRDDTGDVIGFISCSYIPCFVAFVVTVITQFRAHRRRESLWNAVFAVFTFLAWYRSIHALWA